MLKINYGLQHGIRQRIPDQINFLIAQKIGKILGQELINLFGKKCFTESFLNNSGGYFTRAEIPAKLPGGGIPEVYPPHFFHSRFFRLQP
jgi:hypothetical protein